MKKYFLILSIALLFAFSNNVLADQCDDAYYAADDTYSYARKGYNSGYLEDIQFYAMKTVSMQFLKAIDMVLIIQILSGIKIK